MTEPDAINGPVAITGANGQLGTALQAALADAPNEVRPLGRDDDLGKALADAAVVVHLAGTLLPRGGDTYESSNLDTVRAVVDRLADTSVTRVVFTSFPGASPDSTNPYLRAKGAAEELLARQRIPSVVLRCDHVVGPPTDPGPTAAALQASGRSARVLGTGDNRVAPVVRADVIEALRRVTLHRGTPTGRLELHGPETLTVDELCRLVNAPGTRVRHVPVWLGRAMAAFTPALTPALVQIMTSDVVPGGEVGDAASELQLPRTSLSEVWGRT